MIYFVDEDIGQLRSWVIELRMRGHKVSTIRDADEAWNRLVRCVDARLVLIDVMLGVDDRSSRFPRDRTNNHLETGLHLLDDLCSQNPALFPEKAAILTMTGIQRLLKLAQEKASDLRIPFLRKFDYPTPFEFANRVEAILGNGA